MISHYLFDDDVHFFAIELNAPLSVAPTRVTRVHGHKTQEPMASVCAYEVILCDEFATHLLHSA